ncbi:MAG: hypothetical protein SV422_15615 [Pseudomonadota bacterium]|nr:hypothetical protein [Pseudomonadota bacterium]
MNDKATIDDTMLSAWLDGELPPQQMAAVRAALDAEPALAERLAALRSVDALVLRHARALDATPLPASVLGMLADDSAQNSAQNAPTNTSATVVQGPWQRWSRSSGAHVALAASLVLALVIVLTQPFAPLPSALPELAAYAAQLDTTASGTSVAVGDATLSTRFTFVDREGRHCRQYQLGNAGSGSENVACHDVTGWTLVATLPAVAQAPTAPELYQPVSSSAELNALLDAMMTGPALTPAAEAALIERGWQRE